jgi:hypothetical protein
MEEELAEKKKEKKELGAVAREAWAVLRALEKGRRERGRLRRRRRRWRR